MKHMKVINYCVIIEHIDVQTDDEEFQDPE